MRGGGGTHISEARCGAPDFVVVVRCGPPAILTFTGTAVGTCYGQTIESVIWGTSIYVKDGDAWKWTFGISVPAQM